MFHAGKARSAKLITILFAAAILQGCGTTTSLQAVDDIASRPDLSSYDCIMVGQFIDRATESKTFRNDAEGAAKKNDYEIDVEVGADTFANAVVAELRKTTTFSSVERGTSPQAGDLYIEGDITRYARGNAAAKFIIGLGAGSTYFDAVVRLHGGDSPETLGTVVVDRNSWVLGGVVSAAQNIEGFMRNGAIKVAREVSAAKTGIEPAQ